MSCHPHRAALVEGARALLVEARSRRIPLAIATASRMPHALVQAAGLKTLLLQRGGDALRVSLHLKTAP